MSAHAGIFFFDGRPAEPASHALRAGLTAFAPDGVSTYAAPGIAMAHGAFHVWAGERSAQQPARSLAGFAIVWDGRLDNRDELLLRLGEPLSDEMGDAEVALAAFERWGVSGLRGLVGEWSAAIWDSCRRVLHLARDYIGVRPLYYHVDDRSVAWSTTLGEIAERTGRVNTLSDEFAARFMTMQFAGEVTPYLGIQALPSAACISFSFARAETRQRFWKLEPAMIRVGDRRQYEDRLRALWMEAVGSRLRANGTVWAELSGGLDSSSVVCMADRLIKSGRVAARAIQPISHATLQSPDGDERRFIAEVESRIGVASVLIGVEDHQDVVDSAWDWVTPFAARGVGLATARRIREGGGRLVLSGRVGDAVMGCEPDNSVAVFDDVGDANIIRALSNIRRWSRSCRKPFLEIAWRLAQRLTPGRVVTALDEYAAKPAEEGVGLLANRLRPLIVDDRADAARTLARLRRSKRDLAAMMMAYADASRLTIPDVPGPLTCTYPFTHRPLVEFVLAIPGEELSEPGQFRSLMRRAFEGIVPPRILRRTSKGYYPPSGMRAIRPLVAAMRPVERLEIVRRGWIDPRRLDEAIHLFIDGAGHGGEAAQRALRLEQWLVSRHRRAPAVHAKREEVRCHEVLDA